MIPTHPYPATGCLFMLQPQESIITALRHVLVFAVTNGLLKQEDKRAERQMML